jgi:hypothetical protein
LQPSCVQIAAQAASYFELTAALHPLCAEPLRVEQHADSWAHVMPVLPPSPVGAPVPPDEPLEPLDPFDEVDPLDEPEELPLAVHWFSCVEHLALAQLPRPDRQPVHALSMLV